MASVVQQSIVQQRVVQRQGQASSDKERGLHFRLGIVSGRHFTVNALVCPGEEVNFCSGWHGLVKMRAVRGWVAERVAKQKYTEVICVGVIRKTNTGNTRFVSILRINDSYVKIRISKRQIMYILERKLCLLPKARVLTEDREPCSLFLLFSV